MKTTNFRKNTNFIKHEDNLDRYFKSIAKYKTLTPEEEREAARAHDYNKLVCANMRFAITVARRYEHMGDLLDLIQCANEGLMAAAKNYNPEKEDCKRFITYAEMYMVREVLNHVRKQNTTYTRDDFFMAKRIDTFRQNYVAKYGEEPSMEEIADAFGKTPEYIEDVVYGNYSMVPMETPLDADGDLTLEGTISGDFVSDVYTNCSDKRVEISCALKKYLGSKEQRVVILYWGLNGNQQMSVDDIAYEMKLTTTRVNQLKKSALEKLAKVCGLKEML